MTKCNGVGIEKDDVEILHWNIISSSVLTRHVSQTPPSLGNLMAV